MSRSDLGLHAAGLLEKIRKNPPLVHNITNYVVMNNTANALLALGASPVMAHACDEAAEMAAIASSLVINIGTLSPSWIEAMFIAGEKAGSLGKPIVLDPVGSGATTLRTQTALRLAQELNISIIRGNASEVMSLAGEEAAARGVDSVHGVDQAKGAAVGMARELNRVVAITGARDLVTDGEKLYVIEGGHPMMGRVTGMGCTATALIAAFAAVEKDYCLAAACGLACMGLAGELAAAKSKGPGSFQVEFLDALYGLEPARLAEKERIRA